MRTEDDLRAALTSLERHAPAAARVLPGRRRHPGPWPRSPKAIGWLAGVATAAALAGLVTTLALPASTSKGIRNGRVASPSGATSATTVPAKVLAAFSTLGDEIVNEHGWITGTGPGSAIVEEGWSYPGLPGAGQQVRTRGLTESLDGKMHQDVGQIYRMPAREPSGLLARFTHKGERIFVNYVDKTWSDTKNTLVLGSNEPATLALLVKTEHWTVRSTTLNGRAALELSSKGAGFFVKIWVDPGTYLPLREVTSFGPKDQITSATLDYQYLPPTTANLAKLTVPIPAGFKRIFPHPVSSQPIPISR